MTAKSAALFLTLALAPMTAHGGAPPPGYFGFGAPAPILNSPVFAVRGVPPNAPGYLQTVKYIDDRIRYIDPGSRFFISPVGEMCFRIRPRYPTVYYDTYYRNWCVYPRYVGRVEAGIGLTSNEVRLWCRYAAPQCAHSFDEVANSISAPTIEFRGERAALENLIYIMGGNLAPPRALE